jgi:hypothetical protein
MRVRPRALDELERPHEIGDHRHEEQSHFREVVRNAGTAAAWMFVPVMTWLANRYVLAKVRRVLSARGQ